MTELLEGTLADLATLMPAPPDFRRGYFTNVRPTAPSAGAPLTLTCDNTYWRRWLALTATYTASSSAGVRLPVVNILDGDGTVLLQLPAGPAISAGEAWLISAGLDSVPALPGGTSVTADGAVTGPAAGAAIASAALTGGEWVVNWQVGVGGTTSGTEQNNFGLFLGAAQLAQSENSQTSGNNTAQEAVTLEVPAGGATLAIEAISLATATAVYRAQFSATMASGLATYPILPDVLLKSGWSLQLTATGILSGDTITGASGIVERYSSDWASGTLAEDEERLVRAILRAVRENR